MLKVHLPSINPTETSIITWINIVPFRKVQTHSNFKSLKSPSVEFGVFEQTINYYTNHTSIYFASRSCLPPPD